MSITYEKENIAVTKYTDSPDWNPSNNYRLHIAIVTEADATFSAIVLNLPGIGSCGDTMDAAIQNALDAARAALEVYEESGEEIPWVDTSAADAPPGAKQRWVTLDG